MKITTTNITFYRIVLSFLGDTPNSYASETFTDYDAAVKYWQEEFRDRKKGDRYDEYWNNVPLAILSETITRTVIREER